jgi:predicted PurR-regulated permease PerM
MRPPAPRLPVDERDVVKEFALERYKYILQQIHATNENVYKFLALYQTLAGTLAAAGLALFVGYKGWGVTPTVTRAGLIGLLSLITVIGAFTILLVLVGILTWLDYRNEECELTDEIVYSGFRKKPRVRNFFRWYETYIVAFIATSIAFMWWFAATFILPFVK